jgi:hypothetical protein
MDLALIGMTLDTSHRYHTRRYTLATQIHCKLLSDISINNHKGSHRENECQRVEILEFPDGFGINYYACDCVNDVNVSAQSL